MLSALIDVEQEGNSLGGKCEARAICVFPVPWRYKLFLVRDDSHSLRHILSSYSISGANRGFAT